MSLKKPFAILETQCDLEHSGQHIMKASQSLWLDTRTESSDSLHRRASAMPTSPREQALLHTALHVVAASALSVPALQGMLLSPGRPAPCHPKHALNMPLTC